VGTIVAFYLSYFRVIFYSVYLYSSIASVLLNRNPFLRDAVIWIPIPTVRKKLAAAASNNPAQGTEFIEFLLEYRPLQRGLAQHLIHAVTAAQWRQTPLDVDRFAAPRLVEPWEKPPEWMNIQETPDKLHPSPAWLNALEQLKNQLASARTQSGIALKTQEYRRFTEQLEKFRQQTLLESPRWNHYYLPTLDTWISAAAAELARLQEEMRRVEPISRNLYRPGEMLRPGTDRALFLGRLDLKEQLARQILTSPQMPLFLLHGQRRVGKSSLLNFLPELLGSGFKLVYQDCQDARVSGICAWLADLRRLIEKELKLPESGWQAPADWLAAWADMQEFLGQLMRDRNDRLILAFDEYETLHSYLRADPAAGGRLLGALRSFSQQQNRVVFLFTGAALFSELREPNWSQYFVQALRFTVDYLAQADAVKLITDPVDLDYPPEVPQRLFALTQGHPALLQLLCRELVDIANRDMKKRMSMADLDEALGHAINQETLAIEVFWSEFCAAPEMKQAVWQITRGETPEHKPSLNRLKEHGYIVQDGAGWKLRVPLFEQWLREFGEMDA
jgi:hypothetical protein